MSHPYISGAGNISSIIDHLRKSFPASVDSNTVKKLGLAPKNESYVINCLQFLNVLDEDGKKSDIAGTVFSKHKDEDFQEAFSELVKSAYSDHFSLHGDDAWTLTKPDLITFFRNSDQTSDAIGGRQASVFQVLSNKSGKIDLEIKTKQPSATKASSITKPKASARSPAPSKKGETIGEKPSNLSLSGGHDFGLSVKIEINLPSDASAETYDN